MLLDDFFIRALIVGIGIAIIAGPFGCFVVWKRLIYFGETLAHSSLLGVALGYIFSINISITVFMISSIVAILLFLLNEKTELTSDYYWASYLIQVYQLVCSSWDTYHIFVLI